MLFILLIYFFLGTTAAGIRYGKPTVIVPFFGDQFFWGQRVREMDVGDTIPHKSLTSLKLAKYVFIFSLIYLFLLVSPFEV
jgi:hypothetical protein